MVKVLGNRVDLGDVEEACLVAGCRQPVAVVRARRLLLMLEDRDSPETSEIMRRIRALLPPYAIPSEVVRVAEFPRSPNGKIDRAQLARAF